MRVGKLAERFHPRILTQFLFEGEVLRLMSVAVLIKPVSMVVQIVLASYYGAGPQYDAYIISVFLATAFQSTLVVVYTTVITPHMIRMRNELPADQVNRYQLATYLLFLAPALAYAVLLLVFPRLWLHLAAPRAPTETIRYAVTMVRIMALPGLGALMVGMGRVTLNLNRHFRVPAALPLVNSMVILISIILFHGPLGVWALPAAFTLGFAGQVGVLGTYSLARGVVRLAQPYLPRGSVSRLWELSKFVLISSTFLTVNAFLDKMFASSLEAGSISSIAYSNTILNFGTQIFTMSLVTVMFTRMSELMSQSQYQELDAYVLHNLVRITRVLVPGALGLVVASGEIVRVLFEHGAFTAADTARTAGTMSMYLLGLPAMVVNAIIARIFHSMHKLRDKMWLALQYLLTNLTGNLLLIGILKVQGLALSSTIAINAHMMLSIFVLSRYRLGFQVGRYLRIIVRAYLLGAITMGLYLLSPLRDWLHAQAAAAGLPGLIGIGALRCLVMVVVFLGLWSLTRRPATGRQ